MPPVLARTGRPMLDLRTRQALPLRRHRHPPLRKLFPSTETTALLPLRQAAARLVTNRRRAAPVRGLHSTTGMLHRLPPSPERHGPPGRRPVLRHLLPQTPRLVPGLHPMRRRRATAPPRAVSAAPAATDCSRCSATRTGCRPTRARSTKSSTAPTRPPCSPGYERPPHTRSSARSPTPPSLSRTPTWTATRPATSWNSYAES